MAYYYLMSQLPMLAFGHKPAVSMQDFRAICEQALPPDKTKTLFDLLDGALDHNAPDPIGTWAEMETQMRNLKARVLARKAGVEPAGYLKPHKRWSGDAERAAAEAFTAEDPLERESRLDRGRWRLAEQLSGFDPFGFAAVVSYGIRLSIAWRWAGLDKEAGGRVIEDFIAGAMPAESGTAI